MSKVEIQSKEAPQPIGCYSQAIAAGNTVYLSGQIPLDPKTGEVVSGDFAAQVHQVFKNLEAVCLAAEGSLQHVVKLTVFLTEMSQLSVVNEVMATYFQKPYPARTSITVAALPKNLPVEIEAVMVLFS